MVSRAVQFRFTLNFHMVMCYEFELPVELFGFATRSICQRTDLSVKPNIATELPGVKLGLNHVATKIISEWVERQSQKNSVLSLY